MDREKLLSIDMQEMLHDRNAFLELLQKEELPSATEMAEAMLEFHRKYAPEFVANSEQHLASMRALDAETAHLQSLRESAGGDRERCAALMQEYYTTHPASYLGRCFLIRALREVGSIDEAIALCHEEISSNSDITYSAHLMMVDLLIEKKDWQGAIEQAKLAEKSERARPGFRAKKDSFIFAHFLMAKAEAGRGNRGRARRICQRCLRSTSDPKILAALRNDMSEAGL